MADNGKLQFFGQTVYPQTLSTNILNPDGTPAPVLPVPSSANAGQVPVVNAAGNGYELQAQSSGGITLSQVIAREETLPAATADSPDFVEVGGVLYRKKAVEGGANQLYGTWVWNDGDLPAPGQSIQQNINFTSGGSSYSSMTFNNEKVGSSLSLLYGTSSPYNSLVWTDEKYKNVDFGTQPQTVAEDFYTYFTANATKTGGGGGTVTYSYVALADA